MNYDMIYKKLQKHLNRQPVGFPRSRSGADLRLLKRHFTPEEAIVALSMSYKYEIMDIIRDRLIGILDALTLSLPKEKIEALTPLNLSASLDAMSRKLSVMRREENGIVYYCLMPLVIGMYEGMVFDMDSEYLKDYDNYAHSMQHGLSFISTDVPQIRTIPIEAAISTVHETLRYDDIRELVHSSSGPIFIIECSCRKRKKIQGEPCKQTQREETCMVFGDIAKVMLKFNRGREISKDEALGIIREGQREGLVLQTYNMQNPQVICSCCGCCCEVLGIQKKLPNPAFFTSATYRVNFDREKCTGCGLCSKKCLVGALKLDKKKKKILVKDKRCIGCGNCVSACRQGALTLVNRHENTVPPVGLEDLLETIMRGKTRWRLARIIWRTLSR